MAQREEKEMDYLEPFLVQMDVVDVKNVKLTRQQALKLRDDCLANLKQRLIDKANLIQARFEKVSLNRAHVPVFSTLYGLWNSLPDSVISARVSDVNSFTSN